MIWHTTGSGKSLTMVMLAKALALHPSIPNPRVVIVTDRIDLDEQIWGTFKNCGKQVYKAESGADLIDLIRSPRAEIITTVIDKFETAAGKKLKDEIRISSCWWMKVIAASMGAVTPRCARCSPTGVTSASPGLPC